MRFSQSGDGIVAAMVRSGQAADPSSMRDVEAKQRPKAVRAIILYPMNALVEDQLVRMRRALDSDEAHLEMDRHFEATVFSLVATPALRQ